MRILVIDDEVQVGRSLRRLLKEHDVSIETDPRAAMDRAKTCLADGRPFDVVLCDLKMAGMTGIEVVKAFRMYEKPPLLILMSGDYRIGDQPSDADVVLMKPFSRNELRIAIQQPTSLMLAGANVENPRTHVDTPNVTGDNTPRS